MSKESTGLGDNIWILIPLTALMIPIFAVIGSSNNPILVWVVSGVIILAALTIAARSLLTHNHNLRMEELEAKERIARAEREQLTAAERLLDLDRGARDLGEAIKRPNDPSVG
jgi:hypothetical protein